MSDVSRTSPGEASTYEPGDEVAGGWSFEALHLTNHFERAALAKKLRARRDVLPVEQPIHELRGSDGVNFFSELSER